MNESTLDAGTREALVALIGAAVALGVSAILTTGLLPRRGKRDYDVGITVFELFSVTAILFTAVISAVASLDLLRSEDIVTDSQFDHAATPLALSIVLLVLLAGVAKVSSLPGGIGMHLPTVGVTVAMAAAAGLYISAVAGQPETIPLAGGGVLIIGAAMALVYRRVESLGISGGAATMGRRMISLSAEGYRPAKLEILAGVPASAGQAETLGVVGWSRKGRSYLDDAACRNLQDGARSRWNDHLAGRAQAPLADPILTRVDFRTRVFRRKPGLELILEVYEHGNPDSESRILRSDAHGLLDLTDLGIARQVEAPRKKAGECDA
jgi:hypothetical protein